MLHKAACALYVAIVLLIMAVGAHAAETRYGDVTMVRIIDGDTFEAWVENWPRQVVTVFVRLAGADTPELLGKCQSEKVKARTATDRLTELLADGPIALEGVKPGKYGGRIIVHVFNRRGNVALPLIAEGLARPYAGGRRLSWCD